MESGMMIPYMIWVVCGTLVAVVQMVATSLLFRERNAGTWMMFVGTIIGCGLQVVGLVAIFLPNSGYFSGPAQYVSAGAFLGHLIFVIGLLWFGLQRRNHVARIAELESILTAQSTMLNSPRPQAAISKPEIV
jgi:hypothetical protein